MSCDIILFFVGATGFEPATTWSQTRRATGLRYTPKKTYLRFADAKVRFFYKTCKFFKNYLIIPCSTNIFFKACTPRSTCSVV